MSLTSILKKKGADYQQIMSLLNIQYCNQIIKHHNRQLSKIVHRPVPETNFPLAGMSVIYALREYVGSDWESTTAGKFHSFPSDVPCPQRWVLMGLMDAEVRNKSKFENLPLVYDFKPTIEDVNNIAASFNLIIGEPSQFLNTSIHVNPTFKGSRIVGGADANMIIGDTLWDIRTTAKRSPMKIEDIVQQIAYYLLDLDNEYKLRKITWYYSRQECLFTHNIIDFFPTHEHLEKAKSIFIERSHLYGIRHLK